MSRVGLVFDDGCQLHEPPERFRGKATMEHAERPERTQVIWEAVTKAALDKQCERVPAREATREIPLVITAGFPFQQHSDHRIKRAEAVGPELRARSSAAPLNPAGLPVPLAAADAPCR